MQTTLDQIGNRIEFVVARNVIRLMVNDVIVSQYFLTWDTPPWKIDVPAIQEQMYNEFLQSKTKPYRPTYKD